MYDVIIIGAGPAGLSAALWCDELGLRTLLIERAPEIGGQLHWIHNEIANHLGTPRAANGRELRDLFAAQLATRNFQLRTNAEVETVDLHNRSITLKGGEELQAENLVFATGLRRRRLNVSGERELASCGIIESGRRDRDSLAGKTVCVVGGGDAAAENALIVAEVCPRVTLIHRGSDLRARPEFTNRIKLQKNIEVMLETTIQRIVGGENRVEAVEVNTKHHETQSLQVDAVIIRIGYEPNTELLRGAVDLNEAGYVQVTSGGETSVPRVFAIGDIVNQLAPTISGAVGDGATVAKIIDARRRAT